MRVMAIVKATAGSEAGQMPARYSPEAMGNYNGELVKAGVMLAGEGLHASATGVRVQFRGSRSTVVEGPFAPADQLVSGFWLWQVRSMDEAVEWARRCPNPEDDAFCIELRQVAEAEDSGAGSTPELREQEDRPRAEMAGKS